MALLAYNLTTSALALAAGNPARTLPASATTGVRGPALNVTAELRGLSGGNYTSLETQRSGGSTDFVWTGLPEFDTGSLQVVRSPADPMVFAGSYSGTASFQDVAADLTLDAAAGKTLPDTAFLSPVMGNLIGTTLTKTGNYLAGLIGALSAVGTKAAKMGVAGVIGIIMDTVTDADAAVLAILDGDSGVTKARAAFGVQSNNSTPGSGFDYGLDLKGAAHDGFSTLALLKAAVRLDNDVLVMTGAGAPVDGTTGDNIAGPGSIYVDITGADAYIQTAVITAPVWKLVTRAA